MDTHDIDDPDQRNYGVWITDADYSKFHPGIAERVGIPHHSPASKEDADKVVDIGEGIIYGGNCRTIFPAVVSNGLGKAYWVFSLVDGFSRLTYLPAQTSDLFGIKDDDKEPSIVNIAGHCHGVYRSPTDSHFAEVDILGTDFSRTHKVSSLIDWQNRRAKVCIGLDLKVVPGPKV